MNHDIYNKNIKLCKGYYDKNRRKQFKISVHFFDRVYWKRFFISKNPALKNERKSINC